MPIALPDAHGMAMLGLTILALVLFSRDRIPLETSCLIVLALLVIGFQVFPYSHDGAVIRPTEFFVGFGHEALVAVCALMIAGQGIVRTGALEPVGVGYVQLLAIVIPTTFAAVMLTATVST